MNPTALIVDQKFNTTLLKKLSILFGLVVLAIIPSCILGELVSERTRYRNQAVESVVNGWAAEQELGGAVLQLPMRYRDWNEKDQKYNDVEGLIDYNPVSRDIQISTKHSFRERGIFKIPIIDIDMKMTAVFSPKKVFEKIKHSNNTLLDTSLPAILIQNANSSSITQFKVTVDGQAVEAERLPEGLKVYIPAASLKNEKISVHVDLTAKGYNSISFHVPEGENKIAMTSTWPHPSFTGQLPQEHAINSSGFTAQWQLFQPSATHVAKITFGDPVDTYTQTDRSIKYSVLIVMLCLAVIFLLEILFQFNLHPMHYLLLTLPMSVFFILLLALSEHISFDASYLVSALSTVALITSYFLGIGAKRKLVALFTGFLSLCYGIIYGLLCSEDYALLLGAISLFIILASFMMLTRKVNWKNLKIDPNAKVQPT